MGKEGITKKDTKKITKKRGRKKKVDTEKVLKEMIDDSEVEFINDDEMKVNSESGVTLVSEEFVDEIPDLPSVIEEEDLSADIEEITDSELILPIDLQKKDLIQELRMKVESIKKNQFDVARHLYFIDINEIYKSHGYKNIGEFLKSGIAGSYRTARYLLTIHHWLVEDVKEQETIERIKELGWSKVSVLMESKALTKLDEAGFQRLIDFGLENSQRDLVKEVRQSVNALEYKLEGAKEDYNQEADVTDRAVDKDEKVKKIYQFYADQYEVVSRAINLVKSQTKNELDSYNLTMICQQFLVDNDLSDNPKDNALKWAEDFESRTPYRVVVVDEDEEPIYGGDLLEEDESE